MKLYPNGVSLLASNICSLPAKYDKLLVYLEMLKKESCLPTIICLQETALSHLDDLNIYNIPNYCLVSKGKSASTKGGLVTYIYNSLKCKEIEVPHLTDIWEGLFVEVEDSRGKRLLVGNVYRPPRYSTSIAHKFIEDFSTGIRKLRDRARELVVVGDFNFNLLKISENSTYYEFFEMMCSLTLVPRITQPTRFGRTSKTLIDNAFCRLSCNIWDTLAGILTFSLSDHQPYFLILNSFSKTHKRKPEKNQFRKTTRTSFLDFQQFFSSLDLSDICKSDINDDPNQSYTILHDVLQSAYENSFPISSSKFNKYRDRRNLWITDELLRLVKKRDGILRRKKRAKGSKIIRLENELSELNVEMKKKINLAKKSYFHNQFEAYKNNMKKTWALLNTILKKSENSTDFPDFFINENGDKITDNKLIAEGLNEFFVNVGPKLSSKLGTTNIDPLNFKVELENVPKFSFNVVTTEEITKIIGDLQSKQSSGLDSISTKLLKQVKTEIAPHLTKIANQVLTTGIFPKMLKLAKVKPLYKKGDKKVFSNYRPISLLPSVSKVLEKIMHKQISTFFETQDLFFESQHGYRKNHGTETAALGLVENILGKLDKCFDSYAVFLDLSKAFDVLNHRILLGKLKKYNFSAKAIDLISNYLSNRYQLVEFQGTKSDLLEINTGVPQGSVLGPLLFLIYLNDIHTATNVFNITSYADDTTLVYSPTFTLNAQHTENVLNQELEQVNNWFIANHLSVNTSKTEFMIFHRKRTTPFDIKLKIGNKNINRVSSFQFLGLVIQENLSWKNQVRNISVKINRTIGVMRRVKKFLPPSALLNIYHSLISCHFNQNLLLWGHEAKPIFQLQKKAIRIVCGKHYLAHTPILFKNLNILKLPDMMSQAALKFYYKFENKLLPSPLLKLGFRKNSDFHKYKTRNRHKLSTPAHHHSFFRKSVVRTVTAVVNDIEPSITKKIKTHSMKNVLHRYKTSLIEDYKLSCDKNCYICMLN